MSYRSEEFKKTAIQKLHNRGARRVIDIADEVGVTPLTLHNWSKLYAINPGMKKSEKRPQDWSAAEKFDAVIQFDQLSLAEQGEFLRKQGLHSDHIASWKQTMQASLGGRSNSSQEARIEQAQDKLKIKELERELRRKEKALAETAALLVLKKKANSIWGTGEDQ